LPLCFVLTEGKGEPAGCSNATATSCCGLPIQASKAQQPPFEIGRITNRTPSFCLSSLTPGLAGCPHQHNIIFTASLTRNLERSTPPHLDCLLHLMSNSTHTTEDAFFPTHFSLKWRTLRLELPFPWSLAYGQCPRGFSGVSYKSWDHSVFISSGLTSSLHLYLPIFLEAVKCNTQPDQNQPADTLKLAGMVKGENRHAEEERSPTPCFYECTRKLWTTSR